MLNNLNADRETKSTMRNLTIDELENVSGGFTTLPPGGPSLSAQLRLISLALHF